MKVAIAGCGLIGVKRAQSIRNATLVACADIQLQRARQLSAKFGDIPYFSSFESMLSEIDADIIVIATPHDQLPALIRKSLEAGKHVLVEKPAARFPEELAGLEVLADEKNCKVRIGFNHRYHRAFRKAKEIIETGSLGDLMFIRGRYGHGGRVGYEKEWRAVPAVSGGGELIDQGSHLIDLSRMFLGDFSTVSGHANTYFWDMPVDDNAFLDLTTDKGQTAFLQVSCTEWKNMFSFEVYGKLEINGLGGSYGVEKLSYYKMSPQMGPPETFIWEYPMQDDSWDIEFSEFLTDIRENRKVNPGIADAVANLEIIHTIYKKSGYDHHT